MAFPAPLYNCFTSNGSRGARLRKAWSMDPKEHAGSRVGKLRHGNRSGGKMRGVKAGKQKQAKVNVAKLVAKHKG